MKLAKFMFLVLLISTISNAQHSGDNHSRYSYEGKTQFIDKDKLITSLLAQFKLMKCRLVDSYQLPPVSKYYILTTVNDEDIELGEIDVGYLPNGMITYLGYSCVPITNNINFLKMIEMMREIIAINCGVTDLELNNMKVEKGNEVHYFLKIGGAKGSAFEAAGKDLETNNTYGFYMIDNITLTGYENKFIMDKISFCAVPK